jgi:spermidine synthase
MRVSEVGMRRLALSSVLVVIGFNSILLQSLFLRELLSVFRNNELVLGIFLAFWLLWPAIGSWGLGRFVSGIKNKTTLIIATQTALFFLIPAVIFLVRSSRFFLGIPAGEEAGVVQIFYWVGILTIPFGLIHGLQFTVSGVLYAEEVSNATLGISRTYIFDTLGDILGGAAFGYLLVTIATPFQTVAIALSLILLSLFLLAAAFKTCRRLSIGFGFLAVLWVTFVIHSNSIDRLATTLGWQKFTIIDTGSSRYGRYVVTKSEKLYSFFLNGGRIFSYPLRLPAEEIVHFTLTQVSNPKQVLVLGLDPQIITEVLKYPIQSLTWVELDPLAVALTKRMVTGSERSTMADPRVKVVSADGRLFVKRYRGQKFDAVIINAGNPTTLTTNRFYTEEFFREVSAVMNRNGVIFLKISSGENYLSDEKKGFDGSIYNALKQSFPNVVPIPGEELCLLGSRCDSCLTTNAFVLAERLTKAGIKTDYVDRSYLPYRFDQSRIRWITDVLTSAKTVRTNRDDKPVSSFYYLTLWGAQSSSRVRDFFRLVARVKFSWLLVVCLFAGAIAAALRIKRRRFAPLGVFIVGMTGTALEIVLILSFQTIYGYVYNLIGAVIAAFMAGILLGSLSIQRLFSRIKYPVLFLGLIILSCGVYAGCIPLLLTAIKSVAPHFGVGLITKGLFPVLNGVAGFFIGAAFPLANHIYFKAGNQLVGSVTGMLYGADLLGGMAGALMTSLFLLPLFGLIPTCSLLAMVNFVVAGLVAAGRPG